MGCFKVKKILSPTTANPDIPGTKLRYMYLQNKTKPQKSPSKKNNEK